MCIVFQINSVVNTGSTGRIVEDIGNYLIGMGWQSYIGYGRYGNSSKSNLIKIGNKFDVYFHGLLSRLFDRHGFGSRHATKILIKKIKQINPDIIHIHNLHGYYINIDLLFKYLSSINTPVVLTLHDCWTYTGHCSHYSLVNCQKWSTHCFHCPQLASYPKSYFDNSFKNYELKKLYFNSLNSLTLVPVSNWLENEIKQSFLSKNVIKRIYNGIDINIFRVSDYTNLLKALNIHNKFIILGVATNWDDKKGLNDFLNLSNTLLEDELIILIGLSKKEIEKLPNNIIGITRTESMHELAEFYSMACVHFNASVEETFGLTIVESMACGTPAIVYNSTACPELLSEESGIIVETRNIKAVRNALNVIKKNGKEFYSKSCRERVVKYFNRTDMYEEYFKLYKNILN